MKYTSLDTIVRSVLLQKSLPMHWYVSFLKYSADCIRELTFDSLRVVNTAEVTLNSYFAADLPCDFLDWTKVGIKQGQFVRPISQQQSISRMTNKDAQGQPIPFGSPGGVTMDFPYWPGYWMFQNVDDLGENLGKMYGFNTGVAANAFKIIRERGQIQFTESFNQPTAIIEYISDGMQIDNATKIDPRVQACVEAYVNWKRSKNADIERSPEGQAYFNQRRLFRARKEEMTLVDIRQILYKNYRASIKN